MRHRNHNSWFVDTLYKGISDVRRSFFHKRCKHIAEPKARISSRKTLRKRTRARICRSFKQTRYRFSAWRAGTKPYLSYWPARLHRLAKSIPQNRFLGFINNYKYGLRSCPVQHIEQSKYIKSTIDTNVHWRCTNLHISQKDHWKLYKYRKLLL